MTDLAEHYEYLIHFTTKLELWVGGRLFDNPILFFEVDLKGNKNTMHHF